MGVFYKIFELGKKIIAKYWIKTPEFELSEENKDILGLPYDGWNYDENLTDEEESQDNDFIL